MSYHASLRDDFLNFTVPFKLALYTNLTSHFLSHRVSNTFFSVVFHHCFLERSEPDLSIFHCSSKITKPSMSKNTYLFSSQLGKLKFQDQGSHWLGLWWGPFGVSWWVYVWKRGDHSFSRKSESRKKVEFGLSDNLLFKEPTDFPNYHWFFWKQCSNDLINLL